MKVGSLVFATDQGLGILAKDFVDNGVVTDVLVIRHGRRPEHDDWYPGSPRIGNLSDPRIKEFCAEMDVMLFFETPFVWELIPFCRELGVKTFLMPMYECMPDPLPYQPDVFLCPSLLDYGCYPESDTHVSIFLPIPVPTSVASRWRLRERAEVFVHNAGHGGLRGRNGTKELIEAFKFVKSRARVVVFSQEEMSFIGNIQTHSKFDGPSFSIYSEDRPYETLYSEGDVLIFPEKGNGLSLPLQEAWASGMLVMATDRFPINTWLPQEPLIKPLGYRRARVSPRCLEFDEAVIDPKAIAEMIDSWYGCDVSSYSLQGRAWAEENSWEQLKLRYLEALAR